MISNLFRRRSERRGLRLWPVGIALALTFTTAITVAAIVFFAGWDLLGAQGLKPERRLSSSTLFDLVKLSFGVVAGAGALVALVVAYRRQRVDEDTSLRDATRLHTERFTTAVSQLGSESAAVRLGGVHALAGLADDAPTRSLRQTCIDVLCAYLRLPYTAQADLPTGDAHARHEYTAMREVRLTVIRLIRDHLRLPAALPHSWQGHDLDFTSVCFDGGDFSEAVFSGGAVDFNSAVFSDGMVNFASAVFSGSSVSFFGANFSGGIVHFSKAKFTGGAVDFVNTTVSDGAVIFFGAEISGSMVDFSGSKFSGGIVSLFGSEFSGGKVGFNCAEFSGGKVDFHGARFSGSVVDFFGAEVSGGTVDFNNTEFSGSNVDFVDATFFGGIVGFNCAEFSGGKVDFNGAGFTGSEMDFHGAKFSGSKVDFIGTMFSGSTVDFIDTIFSGGTVDFDGSLGGAPVGLVPSDGQPLPTGLCLPHNWNQPPPHRTAE